MNNNAQRGNLLEDLSLFEKRNFLKKKLEKCTKKGLINLLIDNTWDLQQFNENDVIFINIDKKWIQF